MRTIPVACMRSHKSRRTFCATVRDEWLLFPAILCLSVIVTAATERAQALESRNILVINEIRPVNTATALVTQQLLSQLASRPDFQTQFYIESLDSTLFDDRYSESRIVAALVEQYRGRKIDVIVAMGPTGIWFLGCVAESFFSGVPVVIWGGLNRGH